MTNWSIDALLDVGSSISMIDMKVCEKLGLPINPFSCDIPHCVGVEGALMTKSLICIMGWVEVEVGILGMGCILARFWVTDCGYCRGAMNNKGLGPLVVEVVY